MIKIYSTSWCPSCNAAKALLKSKGLDYEEINIENEGMSRQQLSKITGGHTVPQIIVNGNSVGGFEQLMTLNQSGKLDDMLNQ
tara:strand:- start:186 stop:434 length:249 start_codon:yes stop_codon:yes gene_type:complete